MSKETVYSKCGFVCSSCPAYKENSKTEADRQQGSEIWKKYFGLNFNPKIIRCEGCQSADPWKNGNLLPDRSCHIRACTIYNGLPTCAHCSIFPCQEYAKKVPGTGLRHQREIASDIIISDREYRDYIKPFEGQTHLIEIHNALTPEFIHSPRPIVSKCVITPFPEKCELSKSENQGMQSLHSLLAIVFSQTASTYAGQILLERKQPLLWGMIWVMGLYGEIREGRLVLESAVWGDKKDCSRLVRKTDNKLHGLVQETVTNLSLHGIQVNFIPEKKKWKLELSFTSGAGGRQTLSALKTYVSTLAQKYGEPVYIDSYRLKGQAFKLFTRLDMNDFCKS